MSYFFATIDQSNCVVNPREDYDHLGTLYTWHSQYTLGAKNDENHKEPVQDLEIWAFDHFIDLAKIPELEGVYSDYGTMYHYKNDEEFNNEALQLFRKIVNNWLAENVAILPVYMYDHSGIVIHTKPFNCPWDSGQVGLNYITKQRYETETRKIFNQEDAKKVLQDEIEELNRYYTGDVWEYTIYETNVKEFNGLILSHEDNLPDDREYKDSCCEFYGYHSIEMEVKEMLLTYTQETC